MDREATLLQAAMNVFNQRGAAATGLEEGGHEFADGRQWALVATGLDVDQEEVLAYAEVLTDAMGRTMRGHPEVPGASILADGLRQMFVLGALHEQQRVQREAASDAS